MKHKFNKGKILKFLKKRFKSERGVGTAAVLLGLMVLSLVVLAVNGKDSGEKGEEIRKEIKDPGSYADIIGPDTVLLDKETETIRDETNKKIINHAIDLAKTPMTVVDDTQIVSVLNEVGVFDLKKKKTDIEEDKKTETNLENSGLSSDKLNVDVSKIIKAKIENNSTPNTSPDEIDAMTIKAMKEKEIDAATNMVSHIEKILKINNKLADQKIINIKNNLNRAEFQKKYLEGIIKAYEDAEKNGGFQNVGIGSVKARLEDEEKIINDLKTELQEYEDGQEEVSEEIVEDTPADEETQGTSTDEAVSEEITEEVTEEVIVLNGTMSDPESGGTMKMSMTINLKTGTVSGIVFIKLYIDDMKFETDVPISGSMNLETRKINAKAGEGKLTGILSADGNSANGTGTEGAVWNVSR